MNVYFNLLETLIEKYAPFWPSYFYSENAEKEFQPFFKNIKNNNFTTAEKAFIWFLKAGDAAAIDDLPGKKAGIIVFKVDEDVEKKAVFPPAEAQGFRLYHECGPYMFFFKVEQQLRDNEDFLPPPDSSVVQALNYGKWKDRPFVKETPARFLELPASELLKANRFDIAMKAHYGRLRQNDMAQEWREHVYAEQALRITGPGREIHEYDGSDKSGFHNFLAVFNSLLDAKSAEDFPAVPVDRALTAMDGAHRIASAIVNEWPVRCVQFDDIFQMQSTAFYYAGTQHGHVPCDEDILDEAAIEYCRIRDTAAIVLIFPCVSDPRRAVNEIEGVADIVWRRTISLSPQAGRVLLRQAYHGHDWIHLSGDNTGFDHKVKSCIPYEGQMEVLLIDHYKIGDLRPVKEKIRDFYNLGKHSVHITDSTQETLLLAKTLFNRNSRMMMKNHIGDYLDQFHRQLFALKTWMEEHEIDPETICLAGSAVLSAYGLRECRDLDLLYHGDPGKLPLLPKGVGSHNHIADLYGEDIKDIVGDPRLHFWYMGVKFCAPELVAELKKRRAEEKDKMDVLLLDRVISRRESAFYKGWKVFVLYKIYKARFLARRVLGKIKRLVKKGLGP